MSDDIYRGCPSFEGLYGNRFSPFALLNLEQAELLDQVGECLSASKEPESEILALLAQDCRMQLMGMVAMLCGGASPATIKAAWAAFDAASWAAPQLAVVLGALDPDAPRAMRKRLLLGCPVVPRGNETPLPPRQKGKERGWDHTLKGWTSLCWRLALEEDGMTWLLQRFSTEHALERLLETYAYEGCDSADRWHRNLSRHRPDLNLPPAFDRHDIAKFLARRWCTPDRLASVRCPSATIEALVQKDVSLNAVLEPLLTPGLEQGDEQFEFRDDEVKSRSCTVPLASGLRWIIVERIGLHELDKQHVSAQGALPNLSLLLYQGNLHARVCSPRPVLEGRLNLCRDRLEAAGTDAICYGAKDTGEMGGGAAIAVYQACGPDLLPALREELAKSSREVGEVVFTSAFFHPEACYVGHIISIKTGTSKGDWCPSPERLGEGVYRALEGLEGKAKTVAISCLATGEGRAQPAQVASLMLGAAKKFFKDRPESRMQVLFCLPSFRDYQAFEKVLAS